MTPCSRCANPSEPDWTSTGFSDRNLRQHRDFTDHRMQSWNAKVTLKSAKGTVLAQEAISANKTVSALQAEEHFIQNHGSQALLSSSSFSCFASSFLGYSASFAPNAKKASEASKAIFVAIYRAPALSPDEGEFPDLDKRSLTGNKLKFRYQTSKQVHVLKKLRAHCSKEFLDYSFFSHSFSFTVVAGKSVALVGQSGCGKSTVLQLIQRFYDPLNPRDSTNEGIFLDGTDTRELAPNWIRRQIENIAFGLNYLLKDSDESEIPMERIVEAAKQANAHGFISDFPEGYETRKQRIAIARALIREPRLLLLDEATAALDAESERIVQAALDEAMRKSEGKVKRTCLVVAHRLSTVENCDVVVVLDGGRVVEWGSPGALLEAKGDYFAHHNAA
ncbi:hypothetical protein Aperf_G00000117595 [Anoplocephala perfoliata]